MTETPLKCLLVPPIPFQAIQVPTRQKQGRSKARTGARIPIPTHTGSFYFMVTWHAHDHAQPGKVM